MLALPISVTPVINDLRDGNESIVLATLDFHDPAAADSAMFALVLDAGSTALSNGLVAEVCFLITDANGNSVTESEVADAAWEQEYDGGPFDY